MMKMSKDFEDDEGRDQSDEDEDHEERSDDGAPQDDDGEIGDRRYVRVQRSGQKLWYPRPSDQLTCAMVLGCGISQGSHIFITDSHLPLRTVVIRDTQSTVKLK